MGSPAPTAGARVEVRNTPVRQEDLLTRTDGGASPTTGPSAVVRARPGRDAATRDIFQVNLQDLPPVTGRRARQRSAAEFPVQRRPSRQTAASRPDPTRTTQMSAIGWHDRSQGLLRSEQRLDGCDSHQILRGTRELPIERDQSVANANVQDCARCRARQDRRRRSGHHGRLSAESSPVLDRFLPALSRSADFFALWIGIATALAASKDERGRRAPLRGPAW